MKNKKFRPVVIMLMVGMGFLGAFSALKLVETISPLLWALYILLILDTFFLFVYQKIKNNIHT